MRLEDKFKAAFNAGAQYQWSIENSENITLKPNFEDWYKNHFPTDPRPLWITIIMRIFGFIPFVLLGLIAFIFLWLQYAWSFIRFGGESIAYTRKTGNTRIHDVFLKLQEQQNQKL